MRIVMALRRTVCTALLATSASLLVAVAAAADERVVGAGRDPAGMGVTLPGSLWVSGDITLALDVPENQPTSGEIDDLSLLARWEPLDRLALFGELRVEDLLEVEEGEGADGGGGQLLVERLYAELLLTPALSVRVGKVFTPFGLWNVITRAPLTWTVEEPAVTENVFPQRATGLSLLYQKSWRGWSLDATAYGPAQNEILLERTEDEGLKSGLLFGGRLAAGRDVGPAFAALGLNAAGFRSHDGSRPWTTATGLDLQVWVGGHEITGELTYRVPTGAGRTEHGFYLQDAIPLVDSLYGVLRVEHFRPRRGPGSTAQLVGLFWRPAPQLVLKADYIFATRRLENLEPGFQASLSLLF